jgi:hypothetical protein
VCGGPAVTRGATRNARRDRPCPRRSPRSLGSPFVCECRPFSRARAGTAGSWGSRPRGVAMSQDLRSGPYYRGSNPAPSHDLIAPRMSAPVGRLQRGIIDRSPVPLQPVFDSLPNDGANVGPRALTEPGFERRSPSGPCRASEVPSGGTQQRNAGQLLRPAPPAPVPTGICARGAMQSLPRPRGGR